MAWSEVDLGARVWTLPAGRAKNGAAHQVPLADSVLRILAERRAACPAGRFVFSATGGRTPVVGVSRAKRRFDAAMAAELGGELAPWVTHDLRRTAATNLAALGVLPHIIETVLNHKGGVIRGVAAVYNRHPYMVERRAALDAWAVALAAIVADAEPLLALAA